MPFTKYFISQFKLFMTIFYHWVLCVDLSITLLIPVLPYYSCNTRVINLIISWNSHSMLTIKTLIISCEPHLTFPLWRPDDTLEPFFINSLNTQCLNFSLPHILFNSVIKFDKFTFKLTMASKIWLMKHVLTVKDDLNFSKCIPKQAYIAFLV